MNWKNDNRCRAPPPPNGAVKRRTEPTKPRVVPGFTLQVYQKNTTTAGPPKSGPRRSRARGAPGQTDFAVNYGRPGFPVTAVYGVAAGRRFRWLAPLESVDYQLYMPVLATGLLDRPWPHGACATLALWDMLARDSSGGRRVLAALPRIVFPLRRALDAGPRDWTAVVRGLKTLQKLAVVGAVGQALVPYYRQLLPPINVYLRAATDVTSNDGLNPSQTPHNVADMCADTLTLLDNNGGPCAYANIKYVIPSYESGVVCCVDNGRP